MLERTRGANGIGPNPLTYRELQAWSTLTGTRPLPWEVALLMRLDGVYLATMAEEK